MEESRYKVLLLDTFNGRKRHPWITATDEEEAKVIAIRQNTGFIFVAITDRQVKAPGGGE
jgi:hypothetical protein